MIKIVTQRDYNVGSYANIKGKSIKSVPEQIYCLTENDERFLINYSYFTETSYHSTEYFVKEYELYKWHNGWKRIFGEEYDKNQSYDLKKRPFSLIKKFTRSYKEMNCCYLGHKIATA